MDIRIEKPQLQGVEKSAKCEVSEETFMWVQSLVLQHFFGYDQLETEAEKSENEAIITNWLNQELSGEFNGAVSRSVITEYLLSLESAWEDLGEKEKKHHVEKMSNALLKEMGGSLTKQ